MIGRVLRSALALLLAAAAPALAQAEVQPERAALPGADPIIQEIGPIGMTVADLDRAVQFYTSVLDFQKVSEHELVGEDWEHLQGVFGLRIRVATLRLGEELIELTEYLAPQGRPIPPDMRSNDQAFQHVAIIVSDMDGAYQRLRAQRVQHASTGPQTLPEWNPEAGGIKAFYFRDPDGHTLEVLAFPPGKGAARWQRKDALFLGIDHTAIVVYDTDRSIVFYRDVLGLTLAGASENWGTEQEHLNNIFGARLRITSLRALRGPAIELLEYLAPRDGRPYPPDSRANDLWHWQTRLVSGNAEAAASALFEHRATLISPGAVELKSRDLSFSSGLLVRDPDGHALAIVER
jgi:catechol 2,3-dioxygenase-like lactoylglutathione lyase family enzyme